MKDLQPVAHYTSPALPTLAEKPSLNTLPKRWARNAAVVACIGVLGASTLAGCGRFSPFGWPHGGGHHLAPQYVVYLTEQETLGVIRAQLEEAGLNFGGEPPLLSTLSEFWGEDSFANLFDEERRVAVIVCDAVHERERFLLLEQQYSDITFGVFPQAQRMRFHAPPSEEEIERVRKQRDDYITQRLQEFIERLENEDILPPT